MSIKPVRLYPPQPSTARAQSLHLSYDPIHDRIAYPNGKSIIVRPLDPGSPVPARQFTKHVHPTTAATFAPSGNYIASGDESGQVKIWDSAIIGSAGGDVSPFEQPYVKSEFQILSGPIKAIAWDGDSSRVIAVGQGKEKFGHCFTWDSGNSIGEIQGHSSCINAVDIKPQRPYRAATISDDKALVFFSGPPFKFDKSIRGHHINSVRAVKFSPDGKWLVSAGSDRNIVIYDGKTGEYIKKIENSHEGGIFGISWFSDSTKFVTASADNTVKSWDIESGESIKTYVVDRSSIENQQVGVIVAKEYIVSLSLNGNLNYFTENETVPVKIISGHQSPLTSLSFHSDSLLTGASDGTIYKWEVENSGIKPIATPIGDSVCRHGNYIVGILNNDGQIISSGWDDTIKFWKDDKLVDTIQLSAQPKQILQSNSLLFVLFESKIEVYESSTKVAEEPLKFLSSSISLIPSTDKFLITNVTSNLVEEYSFTSNIVSESSTKYPIMRSPPTLIRVSPDAKYAAIADSTGKYTLYNTSDSSVITTRWAFHSGKVIDAEWTPDSNFIVSGGLDSSLFVYSVSKPSKVLRFPLAHQNGISGLKWTNYDFEVKKTGSFVSIGLDGVIKTWTVDFSVY